MKRVKKLKNNYQKMKFFKFKNTNSLLRGYWCYEIWKISSFEITFLFFLLGVTIYNFNNSYFTYKNCPKLHDEHVDL